VYYLIEKNAINFSTYQTREELIDKINDVLEIKPYRKGNSGKYFGFTQRDLGGDVFVHYRTKSVFYEECLKKLNIDVHSSSSSFYPSLNLFSEKKLNEPMLTALRFLPDKLTKADLRNWEPYEKDGVFTYSHRDALVYLINEKDYSALAAIRAISNFSEKTIEEKYPEIFQARFDSFDID